MDFRLGEQAEAFRTEVQDFLGEQLTSELEEQIYRTGTSDDDGFTHALAERGWLALTWPEEWGGQARSAYEQAAYGEEMQRWDAPNYGVGVTMMVARAISKLGTDEQREAILRPALAGEIKICLGFTEPESGSDVAAARTRAVRDGDEWVITGQKMFTTNAHIGDYVFLLARSNPDVAKHKGLTTFLVPLKHPDVEVQAVYTLSGERTNITYYNDVRISDTWRVGDVDGGWAVMGALLQDEHSTGFGGRMRRLVEAVEAWAATPVDADGTTPLDDPDVRSRLGKAATELEVSTLLQRRTVWMSEHGDTPVAEGPMAKLFSSEVLERAAEDLVELVGPDALRAYFDPSAPEGGRIEHMLRFSLGTTIYAGTSEVQRGIIAQRGLGLPR